MTIGPNAVQIYAETLGLDLTKWQVEIIGAREVVQFRRAAPKHLLVVNVDPNQDRVSMKSYPADMFPGDYNDLIEAQKS